MIPSPKELVVMFFKSVEPLKPYNFFASLPYIKGVTEPLTHLLVSHYFPISTNWHIPHNHWLFILYDNFWFELVPFVSCLDVIALAHLPMDVWCSVIVPLNVLHFGMQVLGSQIWWGWQIHQTRRTSFLFFFRLWCFFWTEMPNLSFLTVTEGWLIIKRNNYSYLEQQQQQSLFGKIRKYHTSHITMDTIYRLCPHTNNKRQEEVHTRKPENKVHQWASQ